MAKQQVLDQKALDFLETYLNNASPTGYEWNGQKLWMDYLRPYVDTFIKDTYGTAVGVINPEAKFKVVIEGHADEISWYVNYISDKGYDSAYGARPLKRAIQKYIEDLIAEKIISDNIGEGDKVLIDFDTKNDQIKIKVTKSKTKVKKENKSS